MQRPVRCRHVVHLRGGSIFSAEKTLKANKIHGIHTCHTKSLPSIAHCHTERVCPLHSPSQHPMSTNKIFRLQFLDDPHFVCQQWRIAWSAAHRLHDVDLATGGPGAVVAAAAAVEGAVGGQHPKGRPDALPACTGAWCYYVPCYFPSRQISCQQFWAAGTCITEIVVAGAATIPTWQCMMSRYLRYAGLRCTG